MSGFKWVAMWFPCEDYRDKYTYKEDHKYAPQNVILNRCEIVNPCGGLLTMLTSLTVILPITR